MSTAIHLIIMIGVIGGIRYFIDNNKEVERYIPKYSQIELLTYSESYVKNQFKEFSVDDFRVIDYSDNKGYIKLKVGYIIDTDYAISNINLKYEDDEFSVLNGLVMNEYEEKEPEEDKKEELKGDLVSKEQKDKVTTFVTNYFNALNTGTATQFYKDSPKLKANTYYDLSSLKISEVTQDTLIYVRVSISYNVFDTLGEIKYSANYTYTISYNEDTQIIDKIK